MRCPASVSRRDVLALAGSLAASLAARRGFAADSRRPKVAAVFTELRHRSWWRRTRPILALGTLATAVFILLIGGLGLALAAHVYEDTRADVTHEIQGSLARDAWLGKQLVEATLRDQVRLVEREAAGCPPDVRDGLADAAGRVRAAGHDPRGRVVTNEQLE